MAHWLEVHFQNNHGAYKVAGKNRLLRAIRGTHVPVHTHVYAKTNKYIKISNHNRASQEPPGPCSTAGGETAAPLTLKVGVV